MKTSLIAIAGLFFASIVSAADFNPSRLFVKLKEGAPIPSYYNLTRVQHLFGQFFVFHTDNLEELQRDLKTNSDILLTELDYKAQKRDLGKITKQLDHEITKSDNKSFNDPRVGSLWAFKNSSAFGMSVNRAYDEGLAGKGEKVIVAVVDTGLDVAHEDLKSVVWTNPGEIPGNGIDDDGNGYIDDIHGINTLVRDSQGRATMNISDGHGHGTHVSGTIGAAQNNGVGIAGVASNVSIIGIRTVPNAADELDVDVVEAFLYAARQGARIINCSFGKANNEGGLVVSETIKYIGEEYGVLVVAAAGNDSSNIDVNLTYPASFPNDNLLVVASTSSLLGGLSYFSNYGAKNVDVAAPGSSILSTTPGNSYGSMSGTSMASPNTAGVAAEVLSNFPQLSPVELKERIIRSVAPVTSFRNRMIAGGRVDLYSALQ